VCGDGLLNVGVEACDDGNDSQQDGCTPACVLNVCGDGLLNVGVEACDETTATATCDDDCTAPKCGDGVVNLAAGEACDDGNAVDTDTCTTQCQPAACGDGFVQAGEACDDGGLIPGDGCDPTCKKEVIKCQNLATVVSVAPGNRAVLCQRPGDLRAGLRAPVPQGLAPVQRRRVQRAQHRLELLADQADPGVDPLPQGTGAGQYGFKTIMSVDHVDNCLYSSSRPQCAGNFGCDEKNNYALCCAPLAKCGDGVLDPEEQCDDGNFSDSDECLRNCVKKYAPGVQGCG
jgi:cysteine-rich repeat protein